MTSNSLSTSKTNKGKGLLLHSCRSYWWLAVICSVVYGFAGPVYTLLKLDSATRPSMSNYQAASSEEHLLQVQLENMARWLHDGGFLMLYGAAVVLAAVIGCVMFFYLQQKKQVHFYHSQPISRTRLFFNQYLTGLLVNVIPLLVMLALSCLLIAAYHLGAVLSLTAILIHVGRPAAVHSGQLQYSHIEQPISRHYADPNGAERRAACMRTGGSLDGQSDV